MNEPNGASLTVQCLKDQDVKQILGVPGAKIDRVYDALLDDGPPVIVCRHEQNAAFIAGAIGRLTGKPGVCLVTSGPGVSNLATGLVTASTEGDPVVAIGGAVGRSENAKKTHQSMESVALMKAVTKYSVQAEMAESIPEILNNAFRIASSPRKGAAFVSLPMDVQAETSTVRPLAIQQGRMGPAHADDIAKAAKKLGSARLPVILVGMCASSPAVTKAIRQLLSHCQLPVVGTFQGAGVISRNLVSCFAGRIGLFRNQPGDILLSEADVILTIGYDPVEYDPHFWNPTNDASIIHLSETLADIDNHYQPEIELIGDLEESTRALAEQLKPKTMAAFPDALPLIRLYSENIRKDPPASKKLVHPLQFIHTLRTLIGDDVTVTCDMGSHYIWMVRNFLSFEPRRLLVSNGQQTLGVGLCWGIGACLVNPHEKVVSISGDGGFLFSAMELETAVRLKVNLVHFVWKDGTYNMVAFQEKGPVVVEIPIDYSGNLEIGKELHPDLFHRSSTKNLIPGI